jgi:hypothetical protein
VVRQSDWLIANGRVIGAAVQTTAGLYQFSALKYRCLDKCGVPLGFVVEHWRGAREKWQALLLGGRHGAFLRRLLLVPDAVDVRGRHRQYWLDARTARSHGR